jgi:hypothetical protein
MLQVVTKRRVEVALSFSLAVVGGVLLSEMFSQYCALGAVLPAKKLKHAPLQKPKAQNSGNEVRLQRKPKLPLELP